MSRDRFEQLSAAGRRLVQLRLCEGALDVWRAYVRDDPKLRYVDSVVGGSHEVDTSLPADALGAVKAGVDEANGATIKKRYSEPIAAMQDDDLRFPEQVEFAYYSLYNLFRRHVLKTQIDDWLIVNQALSAEADESRWEAMLVDALESLVSL